jgi:hypothetical protein
MTGRGLRGRRLARLELAAVFAVDALVVLLFVSAPNFMRPMFGTPPEWAWLIPAIGIAWHLVGLGLMIRLYPADPEGHRSSWRFDRS